MCSPSVTQRTVSIHVDTSPEKFTPRKTCAKAPVEPKTVTEQQTEKTEEKAPIFLHNPKANVHITSDITMQSHTPRNEWNIGRDILSCQMSHTIWLCLFPASTPLAD